MNDVVEAHRIGVVNWGRLFQDWLSDKGITALDVMECAVAVDEIEEIMRDRMNLPTEPDTDEPPIYGGTALQLYECWKYD